MAHIQKCEYSKMPVFKEPVTQSSHFESRVILLASKTVGKEVSTVTRVEGWNIWKNGLVGLRKTRSRGA